MELLRFLTAGSVDDGKSTLIGRLLYDSKNILVDQLETLQKQSKNDNEVDLALLTDGLRAEREQGITIDVAYKYFSTPRRKYIIADSPGHIQYTRNMVTAASTAHAIVVLVDARTGVIEQTRRHAYVASLMNIEHVIFAINKMDLIDYDQWQFESIQEQCLTLCRQLGLNNPFIIPIAALHGDNITDTSINMSWYKGQTVLDILEELPVYKAKQDGHSYFQVQYVNRPQSAELHDFRGYMGSLQTGTFEVGSAVSVFPSGIQTRVKLIWSAGELLKTATDSGVYTIELEDDVDISRGDVIRSSDANEEGTTIFQARLCWFSEKKGRVGQKVLLQQNSALTRAVITSIEYKIDIQKFEELDGVEEIALNDIVFVTIRSQKPLLFGGRNSAQNRAILIDEINHQTLAAVIYAQY
ncbi:MAG: sulfate adenylyltransferase subunit 1 [Flavobacteriales bacterium]|jgi:sulfate adenylyltransferase subunit 1